MNLIHAWFEQQVAQKPETSAVVDGTHSFSYQALNNCAAHLAAQLQQTGANPDIRIALCIPRSAEQIIAIMGVLKSGAAYVPLDSTQSSERLQWLLQESDASIIVTTADNKALFKQFQGSVLIIDSIAEHATTSSNLTNFESSGNRVTPHNLAYVIYTSGSTGTPKGVMIEHQSVIDYCKWFHADTDFSSQIVVDYSSNYIFDFGIPSSIVPLMLGATIIICSDEIKKDPHSYLKYLKAAQITLINITPSFFKELALVVTHHSLDLPHLKTIYMGGEKLLKTDCMAWLSYYSNHIIFNEYGPTETTIGVTRYKVSFQNIEQSGQYIPIGKPGSTMQAFIFNPKLEPVALGEVGELYIGGSCLARGYINKPQLTEQSFIHYSDGSHPTIRLYKTGDLCKQNHEGDIEYIGRIDKQVKIRGYRIELDEIEIRLRSHEKIQDAVVIMRQNKQDEMQLVAYYILKRNEEKLSYTQLHNYLLSYLPDFMIPNALVELDAFPRTANDKLDERALPEPVLSSAQNYQAPGTHLEQTLAKIWAEEFQCSAIGIHDNFFELGGHSLHAARIIAKIVEQLGKNTRLQDLYLAPTIEQFAKFVEQAPPAELSEPTIAAASSALPLHEFQFMFWLSKFFDPVYRNLNVVGRQRIQGKVNQAQLNLALQIVLQKQDVFSYHIHYFYPLQTQCKKPSKQLRQWVAHSLQHLTETETETYLFQQYQDLFYKKSWRVNKPWIQANLYYLSNDQVELQIGMSHLIADERSVTIFFQELSNAYLLSTEQAHDSFKPYQHYVTTHHDHMQRHASTDQDFWTQYLQDTGLLYIPQQHVLTRSSPLTTHTPLSESFVLKLRQFSIQHRLGVNEILSAAMSLALLQCCNNDTNQIRHKLWIGIQKSTRDNPRYDNAIGCFLRIDTIKLDLNNHPTLLSLATQAQQSAYDTAIYQRASSLVKFGAMGKLPSTQNPLIKSFTGMTLTLLARCFPKWKLNPSIINACQNIATWNRGKQFLINLNILNSFLQDPSQPPPPTLLGLQKLPITLNTYPPVLDKYLFSLVFYRNGSQTPYIDITACLTSDFHKNFFNAFASIIENA